MRTLIFSIVALAAASLSAQDLVVNPHFDSNITGWTPMDTTFDATRDADGSLLSGSALTAAAWGSNGVTTCGFGVYECVTIKPNTSYRVSGKSFISTGQSINGGVEAVAEWDAAPMCSSFISLMSGTFFTSSDAGAWKTSVSTGISPPTAVSAVVGMNVCSDAAGTFSVNLDDIVLQQTTTLPPGDFNNDGNSDLFWHNNSVGANAIWFMSGPNILASAALPTVSDTNFHVAGTGDFQGDGIADVVWRNNVTGATVIWLMNGATVAASGFSTVYAPWDIAGVGDLDGDGNSDIIWRNSSTGDNVVWFMNGLTPSMAVPLPTIPDTNWQLAAVGDFQGDGKDDLVWRNVSTGDNAIWLMNGGSVAVSASLPSVPNTQWQIVGAGDFQGDGNTDLLWRNSATGDNVIWFMSGSAVATTALLPNVPVGWVVARVADFQGDGKADILWHNTAGGENAVWLMNGPNIAASASLPTVPDTTWNIVTH